VEFAGIGPGLSAGMLLLYPISARTSSVLINQGQDEGEFLSPDNAQGHPLRCLPL
jgi:hypothetical protein